MQFAFAQPAVAETANKMAHNEVKSTEKDTKTPEKDAKAEKKNAKSEEKQEKRADSSPKTGRMQVRVVDENGKALPNTELTVLYRGHKSKVSTDKEGKAVIDVPLPDAGYMHLYASPEGYPPIRMIWRNESGNETVPGEFVFTFEQGKTIGGTVRDEQGKPVKDAKIYLNISAEKYEGTNMCVALWDIPILTDSEGKWRLDHAPEKIESMSIRLEHPDYIIDGYSRGVTEQEQIKIENGSSVMILKKGIPLTGTVTDYEGKPVADALVALGKERFGQDYPITRTDKDGRYSFGNLAPGDTALTVVSRGLAPALRQINVQPKMKVVDFHLEKGKTIKLRVVDKDDKPVEGVNISPGTWLGYRTLTPDTGIAGKTDKEGRWAWTWAPKEAVEMSVYKSGYMNVRNLELTPQENEYVITLKKPLTITGKVVDAETKQIIPNIKIVKGYIAEGDNENRNVFWARHEILESNDGRYKVVVSSPFKGHFVRIEAEGYKPGISREFKSDEGDVTYDFAMSKGDNLNVTVLLPDGKPAVGADVRLCPAPPGKFYNMATFIKNGRFSYSDSSAQKLTLAADGRLSIAPQDSEFMLVIVHDQGFAKTTSQALKAKPQIKLEAWARLEGVVKHGTKTLPNIKLDVYESGGYDPKWSFLNFQDQTETDAEGKFFYPKLLPGKWFVRVLSSNEPEITALFPRPKLVELTAGQTTSVTLGGVGRPVIGKIQWPDGKPPEGDLSKIGASLCTKLPERPRPPKEVIAQGPDAYRQWNITWESTDEGKAWLKAAQTAGCGVGVQVKPDGSFRFEGVMPGKYELSIWLMKADVDNLPWEFPETLRYTADCIVPEVPGGVSDEPLDLGAVQLKDASGKELPTTPVKTPAPQAPGEKSVGTMIDHFELLRYVVATNRENTEKIKTWQGKANIQSRSIFIHSGTPTGTDYSATVQFVFDRAKKSIRWNNTLNRYSRINNGVDDPQPVPQIINGMLTPEAFYRYGYYDSPGNPATQKLNLWIHSFTRERINRYQFDFNPLDYLETGRGKVSKDIAGYMKIIDHPGITGIKIIREGDNVTIEFGLRGNIQYYTVSLSQGCNPIHMETKEPNSTWQYRWTYENVDGIWLPKTWTESVHEKDQRDEESKVTFVENVVNRPVAAGAFSLSSLGVKPGDNVQDRRVDPIRQYNYEEEK
jgi:protocatechuate 3,4-dioxygenase beta subunit